MALHMRWQHSWAGHLASYKFLPPRTGPDCCSLISRNQTPSIHDDPKVRLGFFVL
jgi:hypothetical protein